MLLLSQDNLLLENAQHVEFKGTLYLIIYLEARGSHLHLSIIRNLFCFQVYIARSFSISSIELLLSHAFIMTAMCQCQVSAIPPTLHEVVKCISILLSEYASLNS